MVNNVCEKLLMANRGEIALRVMRTANKMNLSTVAIYSDPDSNGLHVKKADEAFLLSGSLPSETYLDINKVINVIKKSGAKYVHPGYGFLSENCKFADAVEKAGAIFVGPSTYSIEKMGDKITSKEIAKKAGVSTVPGYEGVIDSPELAKKVAKEIGYPVIIKASAGGGGKGMRIIYSEDEINDSYESASNEAINSFGDGRLFMEKFIENPRHIEIQIIADKHGNVVCLGERECSIQRNNQKVVEEAPSSFVDEETRQKMYAQSVMLAKEVGYYSAGTVEYIMDKNKNFYFLEVNTRLQVEHVVTEYVCGLDIVECMIRIARGEKLDFTQEDIKLNGWSIECRICSEDPARGFLPSSGRISKYIEPEANENTRVETGVYEGCQISMFYDSMIGKLITYGKDRSEAIQRMKQALSSYYIEGVSHNISFLETIMHNQNFISGNISTSFIKNEFPKGFAGNTLIDKSIEYLICCAMFLFASDLEKISTITDQMKNRKREVSNKWIVDVDDKKYLCSIKKDGDRLNVQYDNDFNLVISSSQAGDNIFRGTVDGKSINVKIISDDKGGNYILEYKGARKKVAVHSPRVSELEEFMIKKDPNATPSKLKNPITGRIAKIKVKEGDEVVIGQELYIIEAMKMQNIIRSDYNCKIKSVKIEEGDSIKSGDISFELTTL